MNTSEPAQKTSIDQLREVGERITGKLRTLESSVTMFKSVFEECPMYIWLKDKNNTVLQCNRAVREALGVGDEVIGKNAYDIFPDEDQEYYFQNDVEVVRTGVPIRGVVEPGPTGPVISDKLPLFDKNHEIQGMLVFSRPVG